MVCTANLRANEAANKKLINFVSYSRTKEASNEVYTFRYLQGLDKNKRLEKRVSLLY